MCITTTNTLTMQENSPRSPAQRTCQTPIRGRRHWTSAPSAVCDKPAKSLLTTPSIAPSRDSADRALSISSNLRVDRHARGSNRLPASSRGHASDS
jgi:hypothetical protein